MNRESAVAIGTRLKASRQQSRRTQKEAALECSVSRQAVSAWERGENVPTVGQVMDLAILYGVSTDFLLFGVRSMPDSARAVIQDILGRAPALGGEAIRPMPIV